MRSGTGGEVELIIGRDRFAHALDVLASELAIHRYKCVTVL